MSTERDITRVQQGLNTALTVLIGKVGLRVLQVVVLNSPVGDPLRWKRPVAPPGYTGGRFRGNWQVSINNPKIGETGTIDKSGSQTISNGKAQIAGFQFGEDLILQNNVPYAQRLNEGHAVELPAGWIERGVQEGIVSLEGERLDFP